MPYMKGLRAVALFAGLAACAKGGSQQQQNGADAPQNQPIDAREELPLVDARPDAPPIPIDAPPDATVVAPDAPPDACVPVATEKLVNPALDLTPQGMGWVDGRSVFTNALPGGPFPIISPQPIGLAPQSVPNQAWFGGASGSDVSPPQASLTDQLHQDITFPADATTFVVSGFFLVGTNEAPGTIFDRFNIDVTETNGTVIESVLAINNTTIADPYVAFNVPLVSNLANRTVRLRMVSVNDDILHTNFFIDSLSFKATFCP